MIHKPLHIAAPRPAPDAARQRGNPAAPPRASRQTPLCPDTTPAPARRSHSAGSGSASSSLSRSWTNTSQLLSRSGSAGCSVSLIGSISSIGNRQSSFGAGLTSENLTRKSLLMEPPLNGVILAPDQGFVRELDFYQFVSNPIGDQTDGQYSQPQILSCR